MYILGINSAYHESAACLVRDGKILAAVEEERFNRIKHAKKAKIDNPNELPWKSIEYCLKEAGIKLQDIDYIGYSLDPEKRLEKNKNHNHHYEIKEQDFGTIKGESLFYEKNLEVEKQLRDKGFKGKFLFLNHHDCHAASAFFLSPFEKAGILVVDGIGEFESTTLYTGEKNKIKRILEIDYPHSLGFLWEKLSKFLGFSEYHAAKVMGLSTYGNPARYRNEFRKIIKIDDKFEIEDQLIKFRDEDYSALENIFGLKKRNEPIKNIDLETKEYSDVAAALQEVTEEIIINLALKLKKEGFSHLCLAGGVALNCLSNGKLLKKGFQEVFIQPAANDAGTAIGAAYYIWNQLLSREREQIFESPYLGPEYSEEEIRKALEENNLIYLKSKRIEKEVAKLISDGKVVAWFQGKLEIGPRALGNRSILANPCSRDSISQLNHKVKFREPFRPFCPSVLEEEANEWFELNGKLEKPFYYMLATASVLKDKRNQIPAVTHIDGTSRIQAVKKDLNPRYHKLILEFYKLTGVPLLLNTSFNSKEPIICNPNNAIKTFLSTKIDYLAIGDFLVSKDHNPIRS